MKFASNARRSRSIFAVALGTVVLACDDKLKTAGSDAAEKVKQGMDSLASAVVLADPVGVRTIFEDYKKSESGRLDAVAALDSLTRRIKALPEARTYFKVQVNGGTGALCGLTYTWDEGRKKLDVRDDSPGAAQVSLDLTLQYFRSNGMPAGAVIGVVGFCSLESNDKPGDGLVLVTQVKSTGETAPVINWPVHLPSGAQARMSPPGTFEVPQYR